MKISECLRAPLELAKKSREYVELSAGDVAEHNLVTLRGLCFVNTFLVAGYFIRNMLVLGSPALNVMFGAGIAGQLAFDAVVFLRQQRGPCVQRLCMVYSCTVMLFIIAISVYPYTDYPAVYFPLLLTASSIMYIFTFGQTLFNAFAAVVVFNLLAASLKTREIYLTCDLAASIAGFIIAAVCVYYTTKLRVGDDAVKRRLSYMSSTDALTGLLNKASTDYICERYYEAAAGLATCSLLVIDFDDFKKINDTYGHEVGDRVLKQFGSILRGAAAEGDIAGRIGGDEFLMLMSGCADEKAVRRRAFDIIEKAASILDGIISLKVSCSVGASLCSSRKSSYHSALYRADRAMYAAKAAGKARCLIYSELDNTTPADKPLVLIASHSATSTTFLRSCLDDEYGVVEAADAEEVYAALDKYTDRLTAALIDMEMKDEQGLPVLNAVKSADRYSGIVVFAVGREALREECCEDLQTGLRTIRAPFDRESIKHRVTAACEDRRRSKSQ